MKPEIEITNYPFDCVQVLSISTEIPLNRKYLSISIMDDATFNIPYVWHVCNNSLLFPRIPDHYWQSVWTITFIYDELIMYYYASYESLRNQQRRLTNKILIYIMQGTTSALSNIHYIQDTFDQVQLIVGYSSFFTQKLLTPSDTRKHLISPHTHHWISVLFSQYDKNSLTTFLLCLYQLMIYPLIRKYFALPYHQI